MHRPDVAAGDVGADGEAASLDRELLGEQAVADRVLWRTADAGDDEPAAEGEDARAPGPSATGSRPSRRHPSRGVALA